jgi:hypothetical protein
MENLNIEATKYTPEIILHKSGKFSIKGKSYPENTFEFYAPVTAWFKLYFLIDSLPKVHFVTDEMPKALTLDMEIIYFNSSSSKWFFDLFDIFDEHKESFDISINWLYDEDNESAREAGEDFIEDFENLNIKLVPKQG